VDSAGKPPHPPALRHRAGRLIAKALVAGMLCFATLGAAALIWTDDARLLRLGIVAALWAALVGAFAAARYRREALADHDHAGQLRRVYELELEREVAARREYELEVEAQTRKRVEEEERSEVRDELTALRAELRNLRQTLETLTGGELLLERVALRAESTRLRSVSDQPKAARSTERVLPHASSEPGGDAIAVDKTDALPRYHEGAAATGFSITQPNEFKPLRRLRPAPPLAPAVTNRNGGQGDDDTGSHAVGRSVNELLSALGENPGNVAPRRRRRRDEQ
jgi:hypothetical protein